MSEHVSIEQQEALDQLTHIIHDNMEKYDRLVQSYHEPVTPELDAKVAQALALSKRYNDFQGRFMSEVGGEHHFLMAAFQAGAQVVTGLFSAIGKAIKKAIEKKKAKKEAAAKAAEEKKKQEAEAKQAEENKQKLVIAGGVIAAILVVVGIIYFVKRRNHAS